MTEDLLSKIKQLEEKSGLNWMRLIEDYKTINGVIAFAKKWNILFTNTETVQLAQMNTEKLNETDLSGITGGIIK
jgi:hypothetical protein